MAALLRLAGWHVASCLLIICHCCLIFLLPSIHFCFSIIFALLESCLRNIPKNKTFQTHAVSFLQILKITYICIWDLLGKCLPCIVKNFAFCQIIYTCKILVFQILFLYRSEAKFGWSDLTKLPSWAEANVTTISTVLKSETLLSLYWNGIKT